MKKYTSVIILILVVVGLWLFLGRGKKAEAPEVNGNKTGTMQTATIPADYNAPLPAGSASTPVKEFVVTGQNFSFTPNTLSVKKGDVVKITFKNAGGVHDFRLDDFKVATNRTNTGEAATVSFVADKAGSFQYYCSVGSHRAMGMWGTLTVQ